MYPRNRRAAKGIVRICSRCWHPTSAEPHRRVMVVCAYSKNSTVEGHLCPHCFSLLSKRQKTHYPLLVKNKPGPVLDDWQESA